MPGKNLLLVSFHDILGVEGGAVPRGREECSGRPRKGLGEGEGSSQGSRERSERKGGRRAKRRGIVDGDGEEVPTDQLLWARKGGRGEVDESKGRSDCGDCPSGRWEDGQSGRRVERWRRGDQGRVFPARNGQTGSKPRSCAAVSSLAAAPPQKPTAPNQAWNSEPFSLLVWC